MDVISAVNSVTSNARERLALLMGALLEGGTLGASGFGVGDSGTSFGPWQFHFVGPTKLGLTPEQAQQPELAARAILPSYRVAVQRVPDALWSTDPAQAAATAAYYAESPAYMYPANRVQSAWATLSHGGANPGDTSGGGGVTPVGFPGVPDWLNPTNIPGVGDAFGKIGDAAVSLKDFFAKLVDPHTWWRAFLTLAGLGIIAMGFLVFNSGTVERVAGKVAASAG